MPNEHRADPTPPPHHGQGRGGSKKESFSLRVSLALIEEFDEVENWPFCDLVSSLF